MLRRACESSWQRSHLGTSQLILVASIVGCVAGKASAQTAPSAQPIAAPSVGQVSINSPLSTSVAQNRPRFGIIPSFRTVYDSNVLRFVDLNDASGDNLRLTPGIDLDYNRLFGRVLIEVNGSAGYDFNTRFDTLNQSRINFSGTAHAPIGAICSFKAIASYSRATFDLNDIQISDGRDEVGAVSTIQNYSVNSACKRDSGFSPIAEIKYQKLSSNRQNLLDVQRRSGSAGIAYAQPSIGTLSVNAVYTEISRRLLDKINNIEDNTDVYGISLGINRSISPRLRINLSGGLSKAVPRRVGVPRFTGATYNGLVEWLPNPRIRFTGIVIREATGQNGISATYVIREDYTFSAAYRLSAKSQFTLTANRNQRDFRGESLTPSLRRLGSDKLINLTANYSYDITSRLRIGLGVSHRWRKADNPIYDYKSTVLTSSIGAHF